MESDSQTSGYCRRCGYSLHGLSPTASAGSAPRGRCPECGQIFDPADPKSFARKPYGRVAGWLASPIGWPAVAMMIVAGAAVMWVSRWNWETFNPATVSVRYYLAPAAVRSRVNLVTWRDWVLTAAMLAALAAGAWWIARTALGWMVRAGWGELRPEQPIYLGRRHALLSMGAAMVAAGAVLGWPYLLAQHWIARRRMLTWSAWMPPLQPPAWNLSAKQTDLTLRAAVMEMPTPDQRMVGLQLLIEQYPASALPILTDAVVAEPDPETRALELRLIGLHRQPSTVALLRRFLDSGDPETRVAAIDALGIVHRPGFDIPVSQIDPFAGDAPPTIGRVPIDLTDFIRLHTLTPQQWPQKLEDRTKPVAAEIRAELERRMLGAPDAEEREAAARALLLWPPERYSLRVAEWGVWIDDHGELKLLQSVLDEIPAFVHRTGNPLKEFDDRINPIMLVTKPIIHITVDQPMAVDVNTVIDHGRVWFAYPRPDDFAVRVESVQLGLGPASPMPQVLSPLENPAIGELTDVRQGYPSMLPKHPTDGPLGGVGTPVNEVVGIGVRWQSIIASPSPLPWMAPPVVDPDQKFAWWTRLRQVPGSWLASRGESERFLYYDGPTVRPTPIKCERVGKSLKVSLPVGQDQILYYIAPAAMLLIHRAGGRLAGRRVEVPGSIRAENPHFPVDPEDLPIAGGDVIDAFAEIVMDAGLTAQEARGLVDVWRAQFFQTDGLRLLTVLTRGQYDAFCPIAVRPTPTETARVGIVLTELG